MSNIIKSSKIVEREEVVEKIKGKNGTEEIFIEEARIKYENILNNANNKATELIKETDLKVKEKINQAKEKSKKIYDTAKKSGYEEGYKIGYDDGYKNSHSKGYSDGKKVADKLIREALEIKNKYIEIKKNIYKESEEDIINLVITIYEKIFYEKLKNDDNTITSLILKGLDSLELTDNIRILVSKEDLGTVENSKEKILAEASLVEDLEVKVDNKMSKGDCIIETSKGNVDVSLRDQVDEIRNLLLDILNSE